MFESTLLAYLNNALILVLIVSSPILLGAVAIGLIVGMLQALTQIQDQTLPQAVKLIVTLLIILILGPLFAQGVADQTITVLNDFPSVTR